MRDWGLWSRFALKELAAEAVVAAAMIAGTAAAIMVAVVVEEAVGEQSWVRAEAARTAVVEAGEATAVTIYES
jgi:hypothetical protein